MPRRSAAEAARTRAAIVEAARVAFTRQGYAAASTTAIADAAGVTRGALYHHFSSKADLFRAAFQSLVEELDTRVRKAALAETDARQAFRAGSEALLAFMVRSDYRQIAAVDGPAVLGMEEWHATDAALGLRSVTGGLRAMHKAGYLAEPPTPALALFVFGSLTEAGLALARQEPGIDAGSVLAELDRIFDLLA